MSKMVTTCTSLQMLSGIVVWNTRLCDNILPKLCVKQAVRSSHPLFMLSNWILNTQYIRDNWRLVGQIHECIEHEKKNQTQQIFAQIWFVQVFFLTCTKSNQMLHSNLRLFTLIIHLPRGIVLVLVRQTEWNQFKSSNYFIYEMAQCASTNGHH